MYIHTHTHIHSHSELYYAPFNDDRQLPVNWWSSHLLFRFRSDGFIIIHYTFGHPHDVTFAPLICPPRHLDQSIVTQRRTDFSTPRHATPITADSFIISLLFNSRYCFRWISLFRTCFHLDNESSISGDVSLSPLKELINRLRRGDLACGQFGTNTKIMIHIQA